jgi:hypothetical protein
VPPAGYFSTVMRPRARIAPAGGQKCIGTLHQTKLRADPGATRAPSASLRPSGSPSHPR